MRFCGHVNGTSVFQSGIFLTSPILTTVRKKMELSKLFEANFHVGL